MYTFNLRTYSSNLRPKVPCSIATQHIGGRGKWFSVSSRLASGEQSKFNQGYRVRHYPQDTERCN